MLNFEKVDCATKLLLYFDKQANKKKDTKSLQLACKSLI